MITSYSRIEHVFYSGNVQFVTGDRHSRGSKVTAYRDLLANSELRKHNDCFGILAGMEYPDHNEFSWVRLMIVNNMLFYL